MKAIFEVCAFIVLLLVIKGNCIRVIEDKTESSTTVESVKVSEVVKENVGSQTTALPAENLIEVEPRNFESDYHVTTSSTTTTTTHKIPPTLLNTKHESNKDVTEKPTKMLKDLV